MSVTIPKERINILESDIESWLYENPKAVFGRWPYIQDLSWIGRQVKVPAGIIDLLGYYTTKSGGEPRVVVVEIKRGALDAAAIAQVCRYAADVEYLMDQISHEYEVSPPPVDKVLIGSSIGDQDFAAASAMQITVVVFSISLEIKTNGPLYWTSEYNTRRSQQLRELIEGDMFAGLIGYLLGGHLLGGESSNGDMRGHIPEGYQDIIKR